MFSINREIRKFFVVPSCSEGKEMFKKACDNNFARTVYVQSCCFGNLSLFENSLFAVVVAVVVA